MKVNVLDIKGNKKEELEVADTVFGITPHAVALAQYVRVYLTNQRQGTASTKNRGDVSGGGKKPWRQKGTGNARAGSNRSPIWRHGGISHGPKPRSWSLSIPAKIRALALKSALSYKFSNDKALVLETLPTDNLKTKNLSQFLSKLEAAKKPLLITATPERNLILSSSNLPKAKVSFVGTLNAYEVMNADKILFAKDALLALEEKLK